MTYKQFLKEAKILENLLATLDILSFDKQIIRIDNYPDYSISEYKGGIISDYFFRNSWNFVDKYQMLIDAEFQRNTIFHSDNLQDLSCEYKLEYNNLSDNCDFLLEIFNRDEDSFSVHGYRVDTSVGDFKLHNLSIHSIDNFSKKLYYEGSFLGDNSDIQPIDWGIYSLLKITAISKEIVNLPFYKSLLSESYLLYKENKFKLAYFITYSAFESFINYQLDSDDKGRLKDKITQLYKTQFLQLEKHQIYGSIINAYDDIEKDRNVIAHGRNQITISKEKSYSVLLSFLILIVTFELKSETFEDLAIKIKG
jgi:hypothetical protein